MPHSGELADKSSHSGIVRHPDVQQFLAGCKVLTEPSNETANEMSRRFVTWPVAEGPDLPPLLIATDGSVHEGSVDPHMLPSTRVGYIQIGCVLVDIQGFRNLRAERRLVDPFAVAALEDSNSPLVFPLPSSNVRWREADTVRDGFRAAVDHHFYSPATRFRLDDPGSSLRTTLFQLAALREGPLATRDPSVLKLHRCPNEGCGQENIEIQDTPAPQECPRCHGPVYPTDCLRVWESIEDFQSNAEALGRLMMVLEHLMPVHYMRWVLHHSPQALSETAFFVDGPLAVFGNAAWIHGPILRFLAQVRTRLQVLGLPNVVVFGVQKTGLLADFMGIVSEHVPPNRVILIDDAFRYRYVVPRTGRQARIFGSETHYGQDFVYKSDSGRSFVLSLPYPEPDKSSQSFADASRHMGSYETLSKVLGLVARLQSDLHQNATVPAVLAHRYTAISLRPGGQVLDLLTRKALRADRS